MSLRFRLFEATSCVQELNDNIVSHVLKKLLVVVVDFYKLLKHLCRDLEDLDIVRRLIGGQLLLFRDWLHAFHDVLFFAESLDLLNGFADYNLSGHGLCV